MTKQIATSQARVLAREVAFELTDDELERMVGGQTAYPCGDNLGGVTHHTFADDCGS